MSERDILGEIAWLRQECEELKQRAEWAEEVARERETLLDAALTIPRLVREEIERMGVTLDERYMATLATNVPGVRYMSPTEQEAIRRVCLRAVTAMWKR